jgi:hypothetical protein
MKVDSKDLENNILIVEYMGAELGNGTDVSPIVYVNIPYFYSDRTSSTCTAEMLMYHKRWDCIMPVAKKVNDTVKHLRSKEDKVVVKTNDYKVRDQLCLFLERMSWAFDEFSIKMLQKVIVDFIKWEKENAHCQTKC